MVFVFFLNLFCHFKEFQVVQVTYAFLSLPFLSSLRIYFLEKNEQSYLLLKHTQSMIY